MKDMLKRIADNSAVQNLAIRTATTAAVRFVAGVKSPVILGAVFVLSGPAVITVTKYAQEGDSSSDHSDCA